MMGQGGSMALEDGMVLAELLHDAQHMATALDAFAARRQPRVGWVHYQSRAAGELVRRAARGAQCGPSSVRRESLLRPLSAAHATAVKPRPPILDRVIAAMLIESREPVLNYTRRLRSPGFR
jgi:2-polyprenyl-6-methoxyphenol hydroxylase-like FAD-dependent oxidoreductase